MVVKVIRRASMRAVVRYLATDKESVKREDPHIVAGLGREGERLDRETVRSVAAELDAPREIFGREVKGGHVWHCTLAFDNNADGQLSEELRSEVARDFMESLDLGDVRWIAVHHGVNSGGHDHLHIVASLVTNDGKRAKDRGDWTRASEVANTLEHKHGLTVIKSRELAGVTTDRGFHGVEKVIAERLHGKGTEPASEYIRRVVSAASVEAPGEPNFVRYLREHNVTAHPGKGGYSYSVPGSRRYQGSKLAPDLSWPRIQASWRNAVAQTADQAAHQTAGRLAAASLRTERTPGRLARESRELGRYAQTRASSSGLVLTAALASALRERIARANREAELQAERDEHERERRPHARDRDNGIGF